MLIHTVEVLKLVLKAVRFLGHARNISSYGCIQDPSSYIRKA